MRVARLRRAWLTRGTGLAHTSAAMDIGTAGRRAYVTLDGNEAVARVAYELTDVIAIYLIMLSSISGTPGGST